VLVIEGVDVWHDTRVYERPRHRPSYADRFMAARAQPLFRLLGFPVHVGAGFVIFMVLLAFLNNGGEFGWWLAGSVAGFTLLHELAHAVVARRAGAQASISLEFMAGFTSYHADRPLSRPWTLAISLAGPLTHVATGAALVVALGGDPFERQSASENPVVAAVWWAGPVIGLINLIPVLPLDGGHATATVLDRFLPGRAETVMTYASVAVTVAALVATPFVNRLEGMTVFIGFLLLIQLQGLFAHRQRSAISPIDKAVAAVSNGDRQRATALFTKAIGQRTPLIQVPSKVLGESESPELAELIGNLPRPFPRGLPANEYLLTILLIRYGRSREAAEYAAEGFAVEPTPLAACGVARAAAALGDGATAAAWLRTAVDQGLPADQLQALVNSPAFTAVRGHPAVQALVGPGTSPTATPRFT
jgi:Zn-dependent protease